MRRGLSRHGNRSSGGAGSVPVPLTGFLLQEDGSFLLQEDGSKIIFTTFLGLAQENSFYILQENGSQIYV